MKKLYKIVLSGGPCGLKSQSLLFVKKHFTNLGYNVFIVPETASMFILGGATIIQDPLHQFHFEAEKNVFKAQMAIEDAFVEIAKNSDKPSLVIFDRGLMDNKAFLPLFKWENLLDGFNLSHFDVSENRYDAIFHLESIAVKYPEYYTIENNLARSESIEKAKCLDYEIKIAWLGHPKLRIIPSYKNFNDKINHLIHEIEHLISSKEIERKWLIKNINWDNSVEFKQSTIKQYYLPTDKYDEFRIREKQIDRHKICYITTKNKLSDGSRFEEEIIIDKVAFDSLLNGSILGHIIKTRKCFLYEDQMFELDEFENGLKILELETKDFNEQIELPPWIEIEKEITNDKQYSNKNLAIEGNFYQ
jgi:CYTH domain-containing protein